MRLVVFYILIFKILYILCSSYQNFVVQFYLEKPFQSLDPFSHSNRQFSILRVNNNGLICGDVSKTYEDSENESLPNSNPSVPLPPHNPIQGNSTIQYWTLQAQTKHYLIKSKITWLLDRCYIFKKIIDRSVTFDLCFGRWIGKFHNNNLTSENNYEILGVYDQSMDEFNNDGSIVQYYTHKQKRTILKVKLNCGQYRISTISLLYEPNGFNYNIEFISPAFCDWNNHAIHSISSSSSNDKMYKLLPGILLHDLTNWCSTFSNAKASYEYCFPYILKSYQKRKGKVLSKQLDILGYLAPIQMESDTLYLKTHYSQPQDKNIFNIFFNTSIVESKLGENIVSIGKFPFWSTLKMEIVDAPLGYGMKFNGESPSVLNIPIKAIRYKMMNGSICRHDKKKVTFIKSTLYFMCPENFITQPVNSIHSINEISACEYQIVILTPLVCAHPLLLPQLVKEPRAITCYSWENFKSSVEKKSTKIIDSKLESKLKSPVSTDRDTDNVVLFNSFFTNSSYCSNYLVELLSYDTLEQYILSHTSKMTNPKNIFIQGHESTYSNSNLTTGYFSTGKYVRKRSLRVNPKYYHGQIVKHTCFHYVGVIIGWDKSAIVPDYNLARLTNIYPEYILSEIPHYLVLLENPHEPMKFSEDNKKSKIDLLYSPEVSLELVYPVRKLNNSAIENIFNMMFNQNEERYLPIIKSDFIYTPHDFHSMSYAYYPDDYPGKYYNQYESVISDKPISFEDETQNENGTVSFTDILSFIN